MQKLLSVPEASKLLETPETNIYMLVRRGILTAQSQNPITISETQLCWYLNTRVPSQFIVVYKNEELKMVA